MMKLPVYVVTGFLDSGKTTFLNNLLNKEDWRDIKILLIQFENGEEKFVSKYGNCQSISFRQDTLNQQPYKVIKQILDVLTNYNFDEIWIEWNGMVPFSKLQDLFLEGVLPNLCQIQKVLHIADGTSIENLLGRTGGALPEQIANSDFVAIRNVGSRTVYKRIHRLLNGINPGVKIYGIRDYDDLCKRLFRSREHPMNFFFLTIIILISVYFTVGSIFEIFQIPFNRIINVFLGIILQAFPFLLIGVLLSAAIQVFVPRSFIEDRFPKSLGMGMVVAILGGFCLPVCDCASIPIFRSLVRKGVPLPVAVTFMSATPVINPVVILSTYHAFNGNIGIVVGRICFGIIVAIIIGLSFVIRQPKGEVLSGGTLDQLMCNCGCYEGVEAVTTFSGKVGLFIRHSQGEFFNVGKYLILGTFIASVFQILGTEVFTMAQKGAGLAVSIIIMMIMSFVLSLCSSSDAVIARSFENQFPLGAIMGFLVFGPVMDIKNVMMLSSGFSKGFIGRLLFTAFVVCFAVVFSFASLGGM